MTTTTTSIALFAVRPERSQSLQTTRTLAIRQCRSSQCGERTGVKPLQTKHSHHAGHHEPTPHKNVLHNLARRKHSIKKRRQWLVAQKGRGLWQGLNAALCQCLRG